MNLPFIYCDHLITVQVLQVFNFQVLHVLGQIHLNYLIEKFLIKKSKRINILIIYVVFYECDDSMQRYLISTRVNNFFLSNISFYHNYIINSQQSISFNITASYIRIFPIRLIRLAISVLKQFLHETTCANVVPYSRA